MKVVGTWQKKFVDKFVIYKQYHIQHDMIIINNNQNKVSILIVLV